MRPKRRRRPVAVRLSAALTGFLLLGLATSAHARQDDFAQPVLTASYPMEIKVRQSGADLDLALRGEHLWVAKDRKWTARQMILYIRHTGKDSVWHPIANPSRNPSGDDYPDADPAFGSSDFMWPYMIYLKLPASAWLNKEGNLEFKLVKGKWGDQNQELLLTPIVTSSVFKVPVKASVYNASRIQSVTPDYYLVNQPNPPPLAVYGDYAFGSVLLLDGKPLTTISLGEPPGHIRAALPAGLLSAPGQHQVQIRDPQNTVSASAAIWVHGPPAIVNVQPKALLVGTGEVNLTARVSGLAVTKVEARVSYTYSAAQAGPGTGKVAAPATIPKAPPAQAGVDRRRMVPAPQPAPASGGSALVQWTTLAFTLHQGGDAWFKLPAGWAKQVGAVRVRLTTPAGTVEYSLPIKEQQ